MEHKIEQKCIKCGDIKSISSFEKQKDRPSHRKICKKCKLSSRDHGKNRLRQRLYLSNKRKLNHRKVQANWEIYKYGICKEDMSATSCEICGSTQRLCIDHDHTTNKVRGLLCFKCNFGLGFFKDNINLMNIAISYLIDKDNNIQKSRQE